MRIYKSNCSNKNRNLNHSFEVSNSGEQGEQRNLMKTGEKERQQQEIARNYNSEDVNQKCIH